MILAKIHIPKGEHRHMSKKKATKLGITAAVAASALVAGNPAQAASVSEATKLVNAATTAANALKPLYSFTSADQVEKGFAGLSAQFNTAKTAISKASAAVKTVKGADKAKLEASLAKANEHVARAARAIDAIKVGQGLADEVTAVQNIIDEQVINQEAVEDYNTLSAAIKKAEAVGSKVYGTSARNAVLSAYVGAAKEVKETVIYEVSIHLLLEKIDALLKDGKAEDVKTQLAVLDRLQKRADDIKKAGGYKELPVLKETFQAVEEGIRADYIKLVDKTAPVITLTGEATVKVENGAEYKDAGATVADETDKEVKVVTTVKDPSGKEATAVDTKVAGEWTVTYTAKDAAGNEATAVVRKVVVAEATPKVESVSAINGKQILVTFNKELDKTSAELNSNYAVYDNGSSTVFTGTLQAKLQEDKKSVILTVDSASTGALTNLSDAKVVVKKEVKFADGKTLGTDYVNSSVKFQDLSRPEVTGVVQTAPNKVRVYFSEPVKDASGGFTFGADNFLVDKGGYIVTSVASTDVNNIHGKFVELTLGTTLTTGEHTLTVNPVAASDVTDYAGFEVAQGTEVKFNVTADATAPTATIKEASQGTVVFKFSEPIENAKDANVAYRHTINGTQYQVLGSNSNVTVSSDKTEVTVNFGAAGLPVAAGTVNYFISYVDSTLTGATNFIKDGFGNKFAAASYTANIVADTTAPTATAKFVDNSNTQIDVTFSEAVTGAATSSNYTLKDKDGKDVPFTVAYTGADNVYRLTTTTALSGTYTLTVKNVKDTSVQENKILDTTLQVTVADKINPTISSAKFFAGSTGNDKIVVNFNEAMATSGAGSIADKANYLYDNGSGSFAALPSDATIAVSADGKSATISFATTDVSWSGTPKVKLAAVTDVAGNRLGSSTTLETVQNLATDSLLVSSAQFVSKTQIKVTLNQAVSSVDASEFKLVDDNDGSNLSDAISLSLVGHVVEDNKSVLTFNVATTSTAIPTDAAYETNGVAIVIDNLTRGANSAVETKTANGTVLSNLAYDGTFADGTTANRIVDKIAPELAASNSLTTADVDADGKIDHIVVEFSEAMAAGTVSADKFTVEGYTVVDAYTSSSAPTSATGRTSATITNDGTVYLRVTEKSDVDGAATPKVTIGTGLKDANQNAFAGLSTATSAADTVAPALVSSELAANDKTLTLTFSENIANATASDALLKAAITTGTTDGTTTTPLASADTVAISGNKLIITFDTALTLNTTDVKVAANALKDTATTANVLATAVTVSNIDTSAN